MVSPLELILVAYLDMDADEIIRDPIEAHQREKAGKKIKALFRFPLKSPPATGDAPEVKP